MNDTIKSIAWCVIFSLGVCAVTVALLILGAWLDAETTGTEVIKREKIVECQPSAKGLSKCQTTYI